VEYIKLEIIAMHSIVHFIASYSLSFKISTLSEIPVIIVFSLS